MKIETYKVSDSEFKELKERSVNLLVDKGPEGPWIVLPLILSGLMLWQMIEGDFRRHIKCQSAQHK